MKRTNATNHLRNNKLFRFNETHIAQRIPPSKLLLISWKQCLLKMIESLKKEMILRFSDICRKQDPLKT